MRTVPVKASRNYEVRIGSGLLVTLGENIPAKAKKVCIVSETNVWPLHGQAAVRNDHHAFSILKLLNNIGYDLLFCFQICAHPMRTSFPV